MPAPLEEEIEIDLHSGIYLNESPYAVGPRLMEAWNAVYGWKYPQVDTSYASSLFPPHLLRVPTFFPAADFIFYDNDPAMFLDIGFTLSGTAARTKLVIGTRDTDELRVWEAETGNMLDLDVGVTSATISPTAVPYPGCSAYWATPGAGANITGPALFFSHREAGVIYYILDSAGGTNVIRSMNDDPIANTPNGAAALCVHLDRLWMAASGTINAFTSNIFYTDPFDAETIRGTSFVTIPDIVNFISPSTPGEIDQTGVAHLFVGCDNSIWMIDGDPTTTQALRRQIADGIGVRHPMAGCVTPYGIVFVGTDLQIYLCTTDGRQLIPLGSAVGNVIDNPQYGGLSRASVVWFSPYLYFFPGTLPAYAFICDLTSPQKPVWWGPVQNNAGSPESVGVTKASPSGYSIHAPVGVLDNRATPSIYTTWRRSDSIHGNGKFIGFDRFTQGRGSGYPHDYEGARNQILKTGYIFKRGQQVEARRVVLYATRKDLESHISVKTINERGVECPGILESITPAFLPASNIQRLLYTFPNHANAVGQALQLYLNGPTDTISPYTQSMDLHRVRFIVQYQQANV